MTIPASAPETELLLGAYVDGELDAASALAFERRLGAEPALAAAHTRFLALRAMLRQDVPHDGAPPGLVRAIAAIGQSVRPTEVRPALNAAVWDGAAHVTRLVPRPSRRRGAGWGLALAACVAGAMLGSGMTALVLVQRSEPPALAEAVADHLRAVMAPQPFDVASSDQHVVKPWFTGRLPFAPQVFDLMDQGFVLVGGRVDVLGGAPAAALVFRHGRHLISLLSQPAGGSGPAAGAAARGFQLRQWTQGGMRYWAVSDVAPHELDAFEAAAKAELGRGDDGLGR
jgi:anti-sigma factor RsiW